MTKLHSLSMIGLFIMASTLTGCAHRLSSVEDTNAQALIATEQAWFQHLFAEDMETALTLVSEDFTSEAYPNKAALKQYMTLIIGSKLLNEETLNTEGVVRKIEGTTAHVGPYTLKAHDHVFNFAFDFKREEAGWRIIGMTWSKQE
jgi:hypothetical protein